MFQFAGKQVAVPVEATPPAKTAGAGGALLGAAIGAGVLGLGVRAFSARTPARTRPEHVVVGGASSETRVPVERALL